MLPDRRSRFPYRGARRRKPKEPRISEQPQRPRRPASYADLTALIDAVDQSTPLLPGELAASTAAAVLAAGRGEGGARVADLDTFVGLADAVGLETLRVLWRDAAPVSLAGALWKLYILRQWCASAAAEVAHLWALGESIAAADAVVAGVNVLGDEGAIIDVADAILTGVFAGDFAVALERAAAVFRVLAAGRTELNLPAESELAERNDRAAAELAESARRWRAGTLS